MGADRFCGLPFFLILQRKYGSSSNIFFNFIKRVLIYALFIVKLIMNILFTDTQHSLICQDFLSLGGKDLKL
jgi:hypothetical protein